MSKWIWFPAVVFAAVGGSLAVVWLISESTGMTYNPGVVAAISGGVSAALLAISKRGCGT